MMQSPEFMQQMSSLMSNPAILDQIIALNPQLASMAPQIREIFQSDQFRQMMSVLFSHVSINNGMLIYLFGLRTDRILKRCVA